MRLHDVCRTASVFALAATATAPAAEVSLIGGPAGFKSVRCVPMNEVTANAERATEALKVRFEKTGDIRRMLALEVRAKQALMEPRVLALRVQINLDQGDAPKPGIMLYERGGGVWYRVSGRAMMLGEETEIRMPMRNLREAAFSDDESGQLEWDQVEKVWVALLMDSPARGTILLRRVLLTDEPYRPTQPIRLTGSGPGTWSVGKDRAAKAELTTPKEGPEGQACMKVEFAFPGGRHMYMVPSTSVPETDLDGYRALRFKYRAVLQKGIEGLLVSLNETDGSQYVATPAPRASDEWTTIAIPISDFKLGSWTKDPDNRLSLCDVVRVSIGTHGTPSGTGGDGVIMAADIELVP